MINYSAHDIERYLNRQMNAAEMHAFEKAMMDDPFLADAVDGYRSMPAAQSIQSDLAELKKKTAKWSVAFSVRGCKWQPLLLSYFQQALCCTVF
jgi:hypothetical protein